MAAASLARAVEALTDEPDAHELQACVGDLCAHAPLAQLTLDYSEQEQSPSDAIAAAQRLVETYWDALAREREHGADGDAYRLYMADVVRLGAPMKRAKALEAASKGQRNALVEGNLLLVVSVAKAWSSLPWRSRMDMIQEGNLGLLRAAEKFDHTRGVSFAHYAYYWITRYVRNEAHRQDIPSGILPYTEHHTLIALRKQQACLQQSLGRELSLTETVAHLHAAQIPPPASLRAVWPSVAEVRAWLDARELRYFSEPIEVSKSWGDATEVITLGDIIAYDYAFDELVDQPAKAAQAEQALNYENAVLTGAISLAQLVRELVRDGALSAEQVDLLALRYGIAHPCTTWRAPEQWRLGQFHGLRQIAAMTKMPRTTLQRRYTRLLAYLSAASHPSARRLQVALQAVSRAARGRRLQLTR